MNKSLQNSGSILIASDSTTDATLVQRLLKDEFESVFLSTNPDEAATDFDNHRPEVLVLAFRSVETSERFNLGLFRQSREIHDQPHRTILMCNRDEIRRAYALCRSEIFDDYVQFWPLAHDGPRLPMSVHHALRELATGRTGGLNPEEFALQVRQFAELEILLKQRMAQGDGHIESTGFALAQAEKAIGAALAGFSRRLVKGDLSCLMKADSAEAMENAFRHLKQQSIEGPLHVVAAAVRPLKQWADDFRLASAPHLESISSLNALVEPDQPMVMVVDDDEFQHKIIGRLLQDQGYRLVFASSGLEALNMLHKIKPDLILMDFSMPDMDGTEVTRRVKGVARFTNIPIIMITSNSEESVVTKCLQAGAIGFMVKPLNGEALIVKIAKVLDTREEPPFETPYDLKSSDL